MNVGYYFHAPAAFDDEGNAKIEAFFAAFIHAIAREAGQVTFYAHSGPPDETQTGQVGPASSVLCVNLGPRPPRPVMYLYPRTALRTFDPRAQELDAMLVRGPTALLPAIARRSQRAGIPMVGLLVADNRNWRPTVSFPWWRNRLILLFVWFLERSQARIGRKSLMLAISESIVRNYKRTAIVQTTSLRRADLTGPEGRHRHWPSAGDPIRLLFTGRLAQEKGLFELVAAAALLVEWGYDIEVELVGGEFGDNTLRHVLERAARSGMTDRIVVTGYLEAGPSLLAAYQRSDIYVLPTFGEGAVPHTVKEAFATGLPVITSDIREIREFITNGEHAILVPRGDVPALAKGIATMIEDDSLRRRLSAAAFAWVQGSTIEASAKAITAHIREEVTRLSGRD